MGSGCPIGETGPSIGFGVSEMGLGSSVSDRSKGWGGTPGFGVPRKWVWGLRGVRKRFGVPGLGGLGSWVSHRSNGSQHRVWGLRNGAGVLGVLEGQGLGSQHRTGFGGPQEMGLGAQRGHKMLWGPGVGGVGSWVSHRSNGSQERVWGSQKWGWGPRCPIGARVGVPAQDRVWGLRNGSGGSEGSENDLGSQGGRFGVWVSNRSKGSQDRV